MDCPFNVQSTSVKQPEPDSQVVRRHILRRGERKLSKVLTCDWVPQDSYLESENSHYSRFLSLINVCQINITTTDERPLYQLIYTLEVWTDTN